MVIYQTLILSVAWIWYNSLLWWWVVVVCKHILVFSLGFDQAEQNYLSTQKQIIYPENKGES